MAFRVSQEAAQRAVQVLDSFDGEVDMAISESRCAIRSLGHYTDRIGSESVSALEWLRRGLTLGTYNKRLASLRLVAAPSPAGRG